MKIEDILISVVVPAYNCENEIKRCVESVLSQSHETIQLLIIDDGSTDNTKEIVISFSPDRRVSYHYQNNKGVSAARNMGIQLANGEYIMFVDADDYLPENAIDRLLECCDDSDIISCSCFAERGEERIKCEFFSNSFIAETKEEKEKLFLQLMDMRYGQRGIVHTAVGVPWGKLYKTELIKSNGIIFDEDLKRLQDNDFNLQAFLAAPKIKYVNEALYYYNLGHISNGIDILPDNRYKLLEKRCVLMSVYDDTDNVGKALAVERVTFLIKSIEYYAKVHNFIDFSKEVEALVERPLYKIYIVKMPLGISTYKRFVLRLLRTRQMILLHVLAKLKIRVVKNWL